MQTLSLNARDWNCPKSSKMKSRKLSTYSIQNKQ
jgi:hypothetical protein